MLRVYEPAWHGRYKPLPHRRELDDPPVQPIWQRRKEMRVLRKSVNGSCFHAGRCSSGFVLAFFYRVPAVFSAFQNSRFPSLSPLFILSEIVCTCPPFRRALSDISFHFIIAEPLLMEGGLQFVERLRPRPVFSGCLQRTPSRSRMGKAKSFGTSLPALVTSNL